MSGFWAAAERQRRTQWTQRKAQSTQWFHCGGYVHFALATFAAVGAHEAGDGEVQEQ
jgi:hypothetical protein